MKTPPVSILVVCLLAVAQHLAGAFYNPEVGRWVNRDPIREDGGINIYGFVDEDAVNHVDRLGKSIWHSNIIIPPFPDGYHGSAETWFDNRNPSYFKTDERGVGDYWAEDPAVGFRSTHSHTPTTFDAKMWARSRYINLPPLWAHPDSFQISYFMKGKWRVCGCCAKGFTVKWMLTADYQKRSPNEGTASGADAIFNHDNIKAREGSTPVTQHGQANGTFGSDNCVEFSFQVGGWWKEKSAGLGIVGYSRVVATIECQ